jgi:hypothetical protein
LNASEELRFVVSIFSDGVCLGRVMKPLLRKHGLPTDSDLAFAIDPVAATTSESSAVRFGKKFNIAVGVLVAVVATSGWLYLITISVQAFVSWL